VWLFVFLVFLVFGPSGSLTNAGSLLLHLVSPLRSGAAPDVWRGEKRVE
jgi:hypothetical protein